VKNVGNLPDFVRVRAEFSSLAAKEACEPLVIGKNWSLGSDGYYYYTVQLLPDHSTTRLFEYITVREEAEEVVDFDFLLYAESVQHLDHTGACTSNEWADAWN
jgi:hypothetical protein